MKIEELKDSNIIHRLFLEDDIFYDIDVHLYILNILMDKKNLLFILVKVDIITEISNTASPQKVKLPT